MLLLRVLQLESQNQELGFDQLDFCYKKSYFISPLKFGDALFLSVDFQVISLPRKGEFFPKLFLLGKNSHYSTIECWLLSKNAIIPFLVVFSFVMGCNEHQ